MQQYLDQLMSKKDSAGYYELLDIDKEISEFKFIISDSKKLHDDLVHQYHHISSRHLDEGVDTDAQQKLEANFKERQTSSKDEIPQDHIHIT